MKIFAVRQPWAAFIVHGLKTSENRWRHIKYRGPILIYAPRTFDKDWKDKVPSIAALDQAEQFISVQTTGRMGDLKSLFPVQKIVGAVCIIDSLDRLTTHWCDHADLARHWIIDLPVRFTKPVELNKKPTQGIFTYHTERLPAKEQETIRKLNSQFRKKYPHLAKECTRDQTDA